MAESQKAIITEAAQKYGVRPDILWGLYGTETSFGKNVSTSSAGAVGPFQFLPSTAKGMGVNPNDFRSAAFGAAKYLSQYKGRGIGGMLSAYNAGPAGGYQSGYVNTTLQNAKTFGGAPNVPASRSAGVGRMPPPGPTPSGEGPRFNEAAYKKASSGATIGKLYTAAERRENPLFSLGILSTKEPSRSEFMEQGTGTAPTPGVPRGTPAPPQVAGPGKLGGFLPAGAELQMNRIDQGQDIKTNPGGAIIAPGDGEVIAVKSDPSGFGPSYPVVKFTSGHLAGTSWYLGHTISALKQGDRFRAGQTLSHTGTKGVGNATVPGWAEIGLSSALGTGNMQAGQATKRYLR